MIIIRSYNNYVYNQIELMENTSTQVKQLSKRFDSLRGRL
jgi:hypothetical protein